MTPIQPATTDTRERSARPCGRPFGTPSPVDGSWPTTPMVEPDSHLPRIVSGGSGAYGVRERPRVRRLAAARGHPAGVAGAAHVAELDHHGRDVREVERAQVGPEDQPAAAGGVVGDRDAGGTQRRARPGGRGAGRAWMSCVQRRRSVGAMTWKPRAPRTWEPSPWMLSLRSRDAVPHPPTRVDAGAPAVLAVAVPGEHDRGAEPLQPGRAAAS